VVACRKLSTPAEGKTGFFMSTFLACVHAHSAVDKPIGHKSQIEPTHITADAGNGVLLLCMHSLHLHKMFTFKC
jgi:hypothetical protein